MKLRLGFVTNSSSTSYICSNCYNEGVKESGCLDDVVKDGRCGGCGSMLCFNCQEKMVKKLLMQDHDMSEDEAIKEVYKAKGVVYTEPLDHIKIMECGTCSEGKPFPLAIFELDYIGKKYGLQHAELLCMLSKRVRKGIEKKKVLEIIKGSEFFW